MCFTTRPDTIFELLYDIGTRTPLVKEITTGIFRESNEYIASKTFRKRTYGGRCKKPFRVFTGAYAEHFTKEPFRFDWRLCSSWLRNGAVMAVPGDERDYAANFFKGNRSGMPEIKNIFANVDISKEAYGSKDNGYCQF
jgi:leucyl-tRNA synthetase